MKPRLIISLILAVFITTAIFAKDIPLSKAEKVAKNFYFEKASVFGYKINYSDIIINETYKVENAYYVFNFSEGWVVVSAEDATSPVLGYNMDGTYPTNEQINYNFSSWMQHYVDQYNYIKENNIIADKDISSQWDKYINSEPQQLLAANRDVTTPLLTALWNQDAPYNLLCPEDEAGPGGHVYVGCVATAMSQIMHYWRYPNSGSGSDSYYQYPYGTISADYDTTYNWNGMQDVISNDNPWDIALIGFHAAVSVEMHFSADGSGSYSWDVPSALENHFNYSTSAAYIEKNNYSTSVWENYMQQDLDAGKPLYYSGYSSSGGHAFVCDAYEGMNYYHFNFGWSGSGNGFFTLYDVGGYNSGQGMVRSIVPGDNNYPYIADGNYTLPFKSGSFTDGSGPVEDYPSGVQASWLISPQTEIDSIESINLSFVEFNTNSNDILRVYGGNSSDGELLGEYSGSTIPSQINYDGNEMFITFSSTGSASGFKAEYTSSSPAWCSNSNNFTEPTGTFSDGSGDFYYNNNSTCVFVIQNPEAVKITLEFTEFNTELDKDKVTVYNSSNQVVATLSGDEIPEPIVLESSTMFITWNTNSSVRGEGWTAEYYLDGVGVDENPDNNINLTIYPNPSDGVFNVNFEEQTSENVELVVTDISGKLVNRTQLKNASGIYNSKIDLSNQPKGIYILSINGDNTVVNRRLIVK